MSKMEQRPEPQGDWTKTLYGRGLERSVPKVSGVYAIVETTRMHGFPIRTNVLYVGQSKSLQRRYKDHMSRHESNPGLDEMRSSIVAEFWWRRFSEDDLDLVEADLIDELDPPKNRKSGNRPKRQEEI